MRIFTILILRSPTFTNLDANGKLEVGKTLMQWQVVSLLAMFRAPFQEICCFILRTCTHLKNTRNLHHMTLCVHTAHLMCTTVEAILTWCLALCLSQMLQYNWSEKPKKYGKSFSIPLNDLTVKEFECKPYPDALQQASYRVAPRELS